MRQMVLEDVDEVCSVYQICFTNDYISFSELGEGKLDNASAVPVFRDLLLSELKADNYYNLVYIEDNKIIGFCCNSRKTNYSGSIEVWLEDWCVLPGNQGKGIGKALINGFKAWAKSINAKYIFTESGVNNQSAHAAVKKLGFEEVASVFVIKL